MRRLIAALLTILWAATAAAQQPTIWTTAPPLIGVAGQGALFVTPSVSSGLVSSTVTIGSGGTGHAAGDVVTMTCSGCTISTSPRVILGSVSGGVATNVQLRTVGVITGAGAASGVTFTQSSSTGSGTGLTLTADLAPGPLFVNDALATGGGANIDGNFFLGRETPLVTLYGAENTFVGDRAGGNFTTTATANSAFGHNACGIGAGVTLTGSFNTCLGNDTGRNLGATAAGNTLVGQNAGRVTASTNGVTIIGTNAGPLVTANNELLIGRSVAPTLTTGNNNLLAGLSSACDLNATDHDTFTFCGISTAVWSATGTGTPSTAATTINGTLALPNITTGTNADFVCASAGLVLLIQSSACTISSLRFKTVMGGYHDSALEMVGRLDPIIFTMKGKNPDWNYDRPQIGLSAENVASIEPRCAIYEDDGATPKSYRQECLIAVLAGAIQEQQREIAELRGR